jgi:isopentenyl-diphosphate delta-isomerase
MGVDCPLKPLFVLHYRTPVPGGLIENEAVHVFGGLHDGAIKPDPAEVSEWKWVSYSDLMADMRARPDAYTAWFRQYIDKQGATIAAWLARKP